MRELLTTLQFLTSPKIQDNLYLVSSRAPVRKYEISIIAERIHNHMLNASQLLNEIKKPIDNWDLTNFITDSYRMLLEKYESDYKQVIAELSAQNTNNQYLVDELYVLRNQIAEKYQKLAREFIKKIHLESGTVITVDKQDYYFTDKPSKLTDILTLSTNLAYYLKRAPEQEYHPENTDVPLYKWVVKRCPVWTVVQNIHELPKGTLMKTPFGIGFLDHIIDTNEGIRAAINMDSNKTEKELHWIPIENLQYLSNQVPLRTQ